MRIYGIADTIGRNWELAMGKKVKEFTRPHIERVMGTLNGMDWKNPDVYGEFLAQTYYHICHSTRLLAAAGARFQVDQDKLHLQCMKHASEERSHEKLSLSDLKEIGRRLEDFPELPATKSLYRSIYYLIEHSSPITLFGYAYFLEWLAVEASPLEAELSSIYGAKAVKHLHVHAHEDPDHIKAYEDALDRVSGREHMHLLESIESTGYNYERIYDEIKKRVANKARSPHQAA